MKIGESFESAQVKARYDKECEQAFLSVKKEDDGATGVLLIVINGKEGHGFSAIMTAEMAEKVPEVLRRCADQIEEMAKQVKGN